MNTRIHVHALALTIILALTGCSSGDSTPAPASLTYGTMSALYRTGFLVIENVPTTTGGAPTGYAVTPALPDGLALDAKTGVISGAPTVTAALAKYTVTASNAGGGATAELQITVDPQEAPQDLPNMGQRITPKAPPGATFTTLKPGQALVDAVKSAGFLLAQPDPAPPAGSPPPPVIFFPPHYPEPTDFLMNWEVGQAVTSVVSADGSTLLVMTTGYNQVWALVQGAGPKMVNTSEWVFVFDNTTNPPTQLQALPIPNAFNGMAFDPSQVDADGKPLVFYVSGGAGNPKPPTDPPTPTPQNRATGGDQIYKFVRTGGVWAEGDSLPLNNGQGLGLLVGNQGPTPVNQQVYVNPCAAGLALSSDGQIMVAVNYANDSVTVFTRDALGHWEQVPSDPVAVPTPLPNYLVQNPATLDLRPGKVDPANTAAAGVAGGEYPFWVAIQGQGDTARAYVSSIRDREVVVLSLADVIARTKTKGADGAPRIAARIKLKGQPFKMTFNKAQTRLYVVEDQSDQISVIDTVPPAPGALPPYTYNTVIESIPVIAPPALLKTLPTDVVLRTGANPTSVTLTPDEKYLWVTNGNHNAVAVIELDPANKNSQVIGLIPTGWYPTSVTFDPTGSWARVINLKSPTGPNKEFCYSSGSPFPPKPLTCFPANEYNPQTTKAGLQNFQVPNTGQLAEMTAQVASNNRFNHVMTDGDAAVMAAVRKGIKHVIFILKENRTYDQILGDSPVEGTDGDPELADFGTAITPNQNALARRFVTMDRFLDTAEVSLDGWPWSTGARTPDVIERSYAVVYAGRELSLEGEGNNRGLNVGLATLRERVAANPMTPNDADLLPGQINVSGPDGPNNEAGTGYLWDNALRAGLTVRNYGFFVDTTLYAPQLDPARAIPFLHDPHAASTRVAYPQSPTLAPYTDPYFRGFDNSFPDYYRYKEWARDFDEVPLANLTLLRLMHDHTGNFDTAIDLVNTPELQVADNDYAVGLVVQKVANSAHANDTLIFVLEDDAQDGGDHVDSHRSIALVVGPFVKQGAVVSTQYNTLNFLRTIEEVLGLPPMNLNDALANPMADIFDNTAKPWSFTAEPSAYLYNTRLPLPPKPPGLVVPAPTQDAAYWAKVTKGMDFAGEDRFNFDQYNRILWKGLRGDVPYPEERSGLDLRKNRAALLERHRAAQQKAAQQRN